MNGTELHRQFEAEQEAKRLLSLNSPVVAKLAIHLRIAGALERIADMLEKDRR